MWIIFFWLLFIWQDDLFTDAVEIVDVQIAPWNTIAYDETMIRIWDEASQEWSEYQHNIEMIESITKSYGDYLITTMSGEFWFINTVTDELWQSQCHRASSGWVVLEPNLLCESRTGRIIELPFTITHEYPVSVSPNGIYAVVFGHATVYQVDLNTNEVIRLGEHSIMESMSSSWLGNTWILIHKTTLASSVPWDFYELAEVSQPDSLRTVESIWKARPLQYIGDYVEWMEGCTLVQTNYITGDRREFDTPCDQGTIINEAGDRIVSILSDDFRTRQIMRFNPETGETHLIIEGEVEDILYTDERQIVILTDNSGWIEFFPETMFIYLLVPEDYPRRPRSTPQDLQVSVLDIESGEVIFQQPAGWLECGSACEFFYIAAVNLTPIGHDQFLRADYPDRFSYQYSVISTSGEETPLPGVRYVLTDYIIYQEHTGTYAYDIATGEIIQLIQPGDYELSLRDDELYVILHRDDQRITYHIRIR